MTNEDLKAENEHRDEGKGLAGAPAYFDSPEEMQDAIDDYFDEHPILTMPPTISGLCYHLGFESRQSFYDYEKREAFSYTIKRARLRMESIYETKLHGNSNAGSIFALKNFGWVDKQEIDQKTEHSGSIGFNGIEVVRPNDPSKD